MRTRRLETRDIAGVLQSKNKTFRRSETTTSFTFENVQKIVGVIGIGTCRTENVQLLGEILEMIERNLKKLFYGETRLIGLDESFEARAFHQLLQLSTGFGMAGEIARKRFADQLHFLVKDLSEMRDDRSLGQGLQSIQLITRDGQDLLDVLKQFAVFTRRDQVVFQRARIELHAQFQLTDELVLDGNQSKSFAFVTGRNDFLDRTSTSKGSGGGEDQRNSPHRSTEYFRNRHLIRFHRWANASVGEEWAT